MDNVILILDQHEMDSSVNTDKRGDYYERIAVRAVLSDEAGRIALMYAKQRDYYKLPGGGVDSSENLNDALNRELLEEVGAKASITRELGTVVEWRDSKKLKQTSYAYTVRLVGAPGKPNFTQSEIDEGFEVKWIEDLDEAIGLVESKAAHDDLEVVFMSKRDASILRSAQ